MVIPLDPPEVDLGMNTYKPLDPSLITFACNSCGRFMTVAEGTEYCPGCHLDHKGEYDPDATWEEQTHCDVCGRRYVSGASRCMNCDTSRAL